MDQHQNWKISLHCQSRFVTMPRWKKLRKDRFLLLDHLRQSGSAGCLLPPSGGSDRPSIAAIVGLMCQVVLNAIDAGNQQFLSDALGSTQKTMFRNPLKKFPVERCILIRRTVRPAHINLKNLHCVGSSAISIFIGDWPDTTVPGGLGTLAANWAHCKVFKPAFMFASLLPWVRRKAGFLMVLGSANVEEGLRGYLAK